MTVQRKTSKEFKYKYTSFLAKVFYLIGFWVTTVLCSYHGNIPAPLSPAQNLREWWRVQSNLLNDILSADILGSSWMIKILNVKFPECNIICIFLAIKHQIKYQSMQSKKYKKRLSKCNITSCGLSSRVEWIRVGQWSMWCNVGARAGGWPRAASAAPGRLRCLLPAQLLPTLDFPWKSRGEKTRESSESGLSLGRRSFSIPS